MLASVPRMQGPRCSSPCESKWQLFITHLSQARDIMNWGLTYLHSIQSFHVCIKKRSRRPCLPLTGRIFNNTSSISFYGSCIHPVLLQDFKYSDIKEQKACANHTLCVGDLTQNGANQRKERTPNF